MIVRGLLAAAAAFSVVWVSACGGPTRTSGQASKELENTPKRILVVHSVTSPSLFTQGVTEALAACGVASTTMDKRGKSVDKAKAEAQALASSFQADYALEVFLDSSERDQQGTRGNNYDVRLTSLADRKEVWRAQTRVHIRRLGTAGTDKDLAEGIVTAMAEASILPNCAPKPKNGN